MMKITNPHSGVFIVTRAANRVLLEEMADGSLRIVAERPIPESENARIEWPLELIQELLRAPGLTLPCTVASASEKFEICTPRGLIGDHFLQKNLSANLRRRRKLSDQDLDLFLGWQALAMATPQ